MERNPAQKAAANYNLAISQLFDHLHCGETSWDSKAAAMGTQIDRTHTLGTGLKLEQLDGLVRASKVSLKGIGQRHSVPGLGIPLVGWKSTPVGTKRRFEFAPPNRFPLNLTIFLDVSTEIPLGTSFMANTFPASRSVKMLFRRPSISLHPAHSTGS
jgi:hypothetical protein